MDARFQRRIQRYGWDKAAAYYEDCWARQLEPAQRRLLDMAGLRPGERVLDLACGTGLVTFPAAEAVGPDGHVTGTDLSDEMVAFVRQAAADRGISHVTSERMDAEDIRLPDASLDVVLCSLGLMYVPDPLKSLSEMRRVLVPGGRAVSAVWGARKHCGWAEIFPIVDSRVDSDVCPMFFQLGTGDVLASVYERAGFTDVATDRLSTLLRYDDDDHACRAAFIGGPVALAHSRFDEKTRNEAYAEYIASIAPYRADGGYDIPGEFVVVSGRA